VVGAAQALPAAFLPVEVPRRAVGAAPGPHGAAELIDQVGAGDPRVSGRAWRSSFSMSHGRH